MAPKDKKTAQGGGTQMEEEQAGKSALPAVQEKVAGLAQFTYDAEDEGAGFEGVGSEDMLIPFLNVLQKTSPQVDEDSPGHMPGAKAGNILNSATQDLYDGDEGVKFIPLHREHKFVEWGPRDAGGGFKGLHEPEEPMIMDARRGRAFGKLESPEGNDLAETFYIYGLVVDEDGGTMPAMIAFASTQIRAYKRWITTMSAVQLRTGDGRRAKPPMFAHVFRLRTKQQENAKGKWYGWQIGWDETINPQGEAPAERARLAQNDELYQAAKSIRALILEGKVQVKYEAAAPSAETDDGSEVGTVGAAGDPGSF